jgi:hypothetical protein
MRGLKLAVDVEVAAGEAIDVLLRKSDTPSADAAAGPARVPDGAHDIAGDSADVAPTTLQTDAVEIGWTPGSGITSWVDRESGRELLDLRGEVVGPFSLVGSRLVLNKQAGEQCGRRRRLGRNRNAGEARWTRSQLIRARRSLDGPHLVGVDLDYQMEGMELLRVSLQARRHLRRVDIEVIMHKIGTWDVENVYLALPFTAGHDQQLWLDRGQPMRPGIDQLPGTLVDYYAVQDGIAWCGSEQGIAVAQRDSHLIQVGPLGYGVRQLSSGQPLPPGPRYAWLMSNYWETNYSAEIGGFYSFRFSVQWGPDLVDPHDAIARCRDVVCPPVRGIRMGRSASGISGIAASRG